MNINLKPLNALVLAAGALFVASGCSLVPSQRWPEIDNVRKESVEGLKQELTSDSPNANNLLEFGISLSDTYCYEFLGTLDDEDRSNGFFKDTFSLAGSTVLTMSGINGASSESIARGGAALTGGLGLFEAYQDHFILVPTDVLYPKVVEGRLKLAAELRQNVKSAHQARTTLIRYHDTCSPLAIRHLVATALSTVTYEVTRAGAPSATAQAATQQLESTLAALLSVEVPIADLHLRTWYLLTQPQATREQPAVAAFLEDQAVAPANTIYTTFMNAATPAEKLQAIGLIQSIAKIRHLTEVSDAALTTGGDGNTMSPVTLRAMPILE